MGFISLEDNQVRRMPARAIAASTDEGKLGSGDRLFRVSFNKPKLPLSEDLIPLPSSVDVSLRNRCAAQRVGDSRGRNRCDSHLKTHVAQTLTRRAQHAWLVAK